MLIAGYAAVVHTQIACANVDDYQWQQAIAKRHARRSSYPVKSRRQPERPLLQQTRPPAPLRKPH